MANALQNVGFDEIVRDSKTAKFKIRPELKAIWRAVMKCRYYDNGEGYEVTWEDRVRHTIGVGEFDMETVVRHGADITGLFDTLLKVSGLTAANQMFCIHLYYEKSEDPQSRTVLLQGKYREAWIQNEFPYLRDIVNGIQADGITQEQLWDTARDRTQPMPAP